MKLGKRERLATIFLLVALVALAVDQFLLPVPAPAAAEDAAEPRNDSALGSAPAIPDPQRWTPADTPVPVEIGEIPDVFSRTRLGPGAARAGAPDAQALLADEFRARHVLKATVLGPRPIALVDNRSMRTGDTLDGFVLESVDARQAVFVSDDQRVVLRVATGRQRP